MAIEATWQAPKFTTYSTFRAIYPFVAFNNPINHPQAAQYRVQVLNLSDNRFDDLGIVPETYKLIPSDSYTILSAYRVRVATISPSGRQSPFSTGPTAIASPLRFDFSTQPSARLPSGVLVRSQRLLFLII
tara:strand:- start:1815 stop:2207 length:393 start_codon:yes stop_codon:yes gene_type:complete